MKKSLFAAAVAGAMIVAGAAQAQTSDQIAAAVQALQAQAASSGAIGSSSRSSVAVPSISLTAPTSGTAVQIPQLSASSSSASTIPTIPAPPMVSAQDFITASDGTAAQVYGSQLFSGAFAAARPTRRSNYAIQAGDQIAVRIFGAVNVDAVQTVDTTGDLFIQGVGPVHVGGSPVSSLQSTVQAALQRIYTSTVGVYVDVLQGGTLGVYLTGDVRRPGRYLGTSGDSLLYFLDQSGGVDPSKGSFRSVTVQRGGRTLATYDLYDFLTQGKIAPLAFEDGDVIFVAPRGAMVAVTGDAVNAYAFEAPRGSTALTGADLLRLARPRNTVTSVGITTVRDGSADAAYYPIDKFTTARLSEGDHVLLRSEAYTEQISVSLQGDLRGPSIFVLGRGARLSELLSLVPLGNTDIEPTYVHIQRPSVAAAEKVALDKALDDLQRAILTTPTLSSDSSSAVSAEAAQIAQFVAQAKQVQPTGTVAVYTDGRFNDVHLENGDTVIFPKKTDVVIVAGEILSPGAFAHAETLTAEDYVNRAGGFTPNANHKRLVLQRADGTALVVNGKVHPRPGDEIVVVPQVISRNFLLFKDLTTVIFQIATSTAAVIAATAR